MAYKKRYNRRYKNKTKKFNKYAYAKTDSKNQSKQIVRLNKKIDNVYKTLRGEIIKSNNSGSVVITVNSPAILPLNTLLGGATLNDLFNGNYAKFIYFNFKFFFNNSDVDLTQGKTLRVVIVQNRAGMSEAPAPGTILNYSQNSQAVIAPFKEGINKNYKILLSKVYTISSDKDYIYKFYNFKKIIGYNKLAGTSPTLTYARGSIFIMFFTTQTGEFTISWNDSLGYVDTKN